MNKDDNKDHDEFWAEKKSEQGSDFWNSLDGFYKRVNEFCLNHKLISMLGMMFVVGVLMNSCQDNRPYAPPQIDYLGSGIANMKKELKDPDSLVVMELYATEAEGKVYGCLTYKAKNSFNAYIQSKALIIGYPESKKVATIHKEEDSFSTLWPYSCENQSYKYVDRTNYYK